MRQYYIDLGFKDVRTGWYDKFIFDEAGIPRYPYPSGLSYNIAFICHFALYHHSLYLKVRRPENRRRFMHIANWIVEHGEETEESFLFPYHFPVDGLPSRWISAGHRSRAASRSITISTASPDS